MPTRGLHFSTMIHILEDFLDTTTIHGFTYLQGKHPAFCRTIWVSLKITFFYSVPNLLNLQILQMIIVAVAFSTAGILINAAFTQWEYNPTLTTLDTIAAPIDEIQFPTVTVCGDHVANTPDNWAALENLLNLVNFDCRSNENDCEGVENVRKDFEFLTEAIVDTLKSWLLDPKNKG